MSNTVTHLAVARRVFENMQGIITDSEAFYLGTVAPDTIASKPECDRNEKKRVHLREGISDLEWLREDQMAIFENRVSAFAEQFVKADGLTSRQRDFALGYLVHLLTDKWNHGTIRQILRKKAQADGVEERDREFFHICTNDLEALDQYLLTKYGEIRVLFEEMLEKPVNCGLPGYIEPEYMEASMRWWSDRYRASIAQRRLKYITENDMEEFIDTASRQIDAEVKKLLSLPE